jgi:hypothetical protein
MGVNFPGYDLGITISDNIGSSPDRVGDILTQTTEKFLNYV